MKVREELHHKSWLKRKLQEFTFPLKTTKLARSVQSNYCGILEMKRTLVTSREVVDEKGRNNLLKFCISLSDCQPYPYPQALWQVAMGIAPTILVWLAGANLSNRDFVFQKQELSILIIAYES